MLSDFMFWLTVASIVLMIIVAIVFVVEEKLCNSSKRTLQEERDIFQQAADLAHSRRLALEEAQLKYQKRQQEPNRIRRQLAADLLFPGYYTSATDYGLVHNWIDTGTHTLNNPLHLLLIRKVKQLEAEEDNERL